MLRREFLTGGVAASAAVGLGGSVDESGAREFYQIRRYLLQTGPQVAAIEHYFEQALIPALNRLGIKPVGALKLDIGPETPSYYLVMPSSSVETLVTVDLLLAKDAVFMKAAEGFWKAPATQPAFVRVESSLLSAFPGWPKLTPPKAGKRIFQMRTYESPTYADHVLKVQMFHDGEFELFAKSGFGQVFYGDGLVGARLPSLTYMLSFPNMAALEASWDRFRTDPGWQTLSHSPKYGAEAIVSNITNVMLSPLGCSQI